MKNLDSDGIRLMQRFLGLPETGLCDHETASAWGEMQWEAEGWSEASMVASGNWEFVNNELVP
jgi:hypothetical protein